MARLIGTSGFSYRHWVEKFYPKEIRQSKRLEYYARFFDTVEINTSFYRLPSESVLDSWRQSTPDNFVFSIKGSRYITHTKRLLVEKESVNIFMQRVKGLQNKLKVVLWQFPPNFRSNPKRLVDFLNLLKRYDCRFAFEFRHESWFCDDIYEVLRKYNVALVISDSPDFPKKEVITADFVYIRLHGGIEPYISEYSQKELMSWAEKIQKWAEKGDIFTYFNNDTNAFAVKNALKMKKYLEKKHV